MRYHYLKKCKICETEFSATGNNAKYCSKRCREKASNQTYQHYACQKRRGLKRKLKLILLRGGACEKCGYKKNLAALCFHHMDEKTFELSMREFSNRSLEELYKEATECELLCNNCHMEHHNPTLDMETLSETYEVVALKGLAPSPVPL